MEDYGGITALLGLAVFFMSIPAGIVHAVWKRTLKYMWLFVCIAGYCFFTFLRHAIILISYDDISDPNYEAYKDWDIWSFILSDVKRLIFWLAIGVLGYFAFIRGNRSLRRLCILGIVLFLLLFLAMLVLGRVSSLDDSMIVAVRAISSCLSARIQLAV